MEKKDMAELRELAEHASQDGEHVYTHPVDCNNWEANGKWHEAASPELFLTLLAHIEQLASENANLKTQVIEACEGERLIDETGDPQDVGYNNAIDDCVKAIRALSPQPSQPQAQPAVDAVKVPSMVLVPLVPNRAMQDIMDSDDWQWNDLLAAAEAITESQFNSLEAHVYRDIHGNEPPPEVQEVLRKLDHYECIAPNQDPIRCARVRCNLGKRCAAHDGHEAPMLSVDKRQVECETCGGNGGWLSSAVADCPSSWATCPACTPEVEGKSSPLPSHPVPAPPSRQLEEAERDAGVEKIRG